MPPWIDAFLTTLPLGSGKERNRSRRFSEFQSTFDHQSIPFPFFLKQSFKHFSFLRESIEPKNKRERKKKKREKIKIYSREDKQIETQHNRAFSKRMNGLQIFYRTRITNLHDCYHFVDAKTLSYKRSSFRINRSSKYRRIATPLVVYHSTNNSSDQ